MLARIVEIAGGVSFVAGGFLIAPWLGLMLAGAGAVALASTLDEGAPK